VDLLNLRERITFFTIGQFQGLLGRLDNAAVLAFRGTYNVGNCLTDADTVLIAQPYYPGRVHHGFAEAIERIWPDVQRLLRPLRRTVPLWITGHSLGGAMATLASIRLARDGYAIRGVCTFGSPRVGDQAFRDAYVLPNYRFVNDNDLVPHLPFYRCYKHVGRLRLVDSEKNREDFIEDLKAWKTKKRKMGGKAKRIQKVCRHQIHAIQDFREIDWLSDHRLDEYMTAIERFLPQIPRRAYAPQSRAIHRVDPAHASPPAPMAHAMKPEPVAHDAKPAKKPKKVTISEEAFLTAFGDQPSKRSTDVHPNQRTPTILRFDAKARQ
jgi:hypothetical protein